MVSGKMRCWGHRPAALTFSMSLTCHRNVSLFALFLNPLSLCVRADLMHPSPCTHLTRASSSRRRCAPSSPRVRQRAAEESRAAVDGGNKLGLFQARLTCSAPLRRIVRVAPMTSACVKHDIESNKSMACFKDFTIQSRVRCARSGLFGH